MAKICTMILYANGLRVLQYCNGRRTERSEGVLKFGTSRYCTVTEEEGALANDVPTEVTVFTVNSYVFPDTRGDNAAGEKFTVVENVAPTSSTK